MKKSGKYDCRPEARQPAPIRGNRNGRGNMLKKFRSRTICLLCFALPLYSFAQSVDSIYRKAEHFSTYNSFRGNTIVSMAADRSGYIWMSTYEAIIRFDGSRFKVMHEDGIYKLGYHRNRLLALQNEKPGSFEINEQNNLQQLEREPLIPTSINTRLVQKNSPAGQYRSLNILFTPDESGSSGYTVSDNNRVIFFNAGGSRPAGLTAASPHDLFLLPSGIYTLVNNTTLAGSDKGRPLTNIKGSFPALLKKLKPEQREAGFFSQTGSQVFYCTGNSIYLVTEHTNGNIDASLLTDQADIESKHIFLYLPEKGVLVVGSDKDGFYLFRRPVLKPLFFDFGETGPEATPEEIADSNREIGVVHVLNDSVLVSQWGLLGLNGTVGTWPVKINSYFSIPKTSRGYFLTKAGNTGKTVVAWNSRGVQVDYFEGEKAGLAGFCNDGDTTYLSFRNGAIWKLLVEPAGTCRKLWRVTLPHYSSESRLFIEKFTNDSLFVAGRDTVRILNVVTQQYRVLHVTADYYEITNTYADGNGTVWFGTKGKGWFRYNNRHGLVQLPIDRNSYLLRVAAITEDKQGYIWVAAFRGLFRFLKKDLEGPQTFTSPVFYNYFSGIHGMYTNEFEPVFTPSVPVLPGGSMIFPSETGKLLVDPGKVPVSELRLPINIDRITADGMNMSAGGKITLPPTFNSIRFEVSVPYFGSPNDLQLEYRLSGSNSQWNKVNAEGVISFNRLRYGSYTLYLRMLSGYGNKEYITKAYSFFVAPFWYQTWWFFALLLLLFLLLTVFLFRLRGRKIRRQNELLEARVALRSSQLIASEEKIRQHARFKSQVTSLVLHDVRSPLFYLNKITSSIYRTSEGRVEAAFREQLKDLHLGVKQVSEYAQNLFAWVNAQQEDFNSARQKVVIAELFEDACTNYQLLSSRKNNTIGYHTDPALALETQADLLQIVIRNLVDNAIKFTANGRITLSAYREGNEMHITVEDTGEGMQESKINSLLSDSVEQQQVSRRAGIGYRYIRDLLKKMDGRISVKSEVNRGTAVTIVLPL